MKRKTKAGFAVGLSLAMALGLTTAEAQPTNTEPTAISADHKAGYNQYFAEAEEYWKGRGIEGLDGTKIKYVSGHDVGHCALFDLTYSADNSNYCMFNDTVFMTAVNVNDFPPGSYQSLFLAAHEYGHRVQDAMGEIFMHVPRTVELGATCLAGQLMMDRYPIYVLAAGVSDVMSKTTITTVVGGSDWQHGTPGQQLEALAAGMTKHSCIEYGLPV